MRRREAGTGRPARRQVLLAVLLDDNNRKPIARLHFNRAQKYLGVFDENKVETRIPITALDEIYEHADTLRSSVKMYLGEAS